MKLAVCAKSPTERKYIGMILVPKIISLVANANASHKARESPRLGPNMPVKPRRSISLASSMVAFRRPGTAARLSAGIRVTEILLKGGWITQCNCFKGLAACATPGVTRARGCPGIPEMSPGQNASTLLDGPATRQRCNLHAPVNRHWRKSPHLLPPFRAAHSFARI